MDLSLIYNAIYIFFTTLEYLMFFYFILSWVPRANVLREMMHGLLEPLFAPTRYLLKHSIFKTPRADLAPIISFCIILFLQNFFMGLK